MSQSRRAGARLSAEAAAEANSAEANNAGPARLRDAEQADRIVIVDTVEGAWRVQAAHMEPLRFATLDAAERAGHRVARTLARLGFHARVETYDAAGDRAASKRYPAETRRLSPTRSRRLDS